MMNNLFNWLQKLILRQVLIIFLVGFTFFGMQAFQSGSSLLVAQADTVKTPEGVYYKGTPDTGIRNDQQVENAQRKLKEATENIREKLNLDQETPEATKEFLESTQRKFEETVEPITGTRRGYYQENPATGNITPERIIRDGQK
jgi:hypothetical protein